jgi:citrate synthase
LRVHAVPCSLRRRYWEPVFEDSLDLIAKLPTIAATIYRNTYKGGQLVEAHPQLDWGANLAHMMGYEDEGCLEMMRLYQTIHADHEGGNVSAHATHLVRRSMGGGVAVPADGRLVHGACFQAMLFCGWLCQLMPDPGLRISRARSTPSPPPQLPGCPRWAPPSATLTCLSPLA